MTHEQYNKVRVIFEEIDALKEVRITSIIDKALSMSITRHDRDEWAKIDRQLIDIVNQRINERLKTLQTEAWKM